MHACGVCMIVQRLRVLKICEPDDVHVTVNLSHVAVGLKIFYHDFVEWEFNIWILVLVMHVFFNFYFLFLF